MPEAIEGAVTDLAGMNVMPKDLHIGNVAPAVCHNMKVPGAIVIVMNENGTISMSSCGIESHAKRNELLSVAIHINLGDMEQSMRDGKAGAELQEVQRDIDAQNGEVGR